MILGEDFRCFQSSTKGRLPAADLGGETHPAEIIFLFSKPQQAVQWIF